MIVSESKSQKINVLGMVARPGTYLLSGSTTILDAISMAGGFKDFAKEKIYLCFARERGWNSETHSFNYKEVIKGTNPEQNVKLMSGDTVVVP